MMAAPTIGTNWDKILQDLKPDWDSYGGREITPEAIKTIKSFHTVPCSSGGIQLEIHQDHFDIEIEIGPDGKIKSTLTYHES